MSDVFVYASAWPIKEEMGGGFRGGAVRNPDRKMIRGDRRDTLEDARNDAKRYAAELIGNQTVTAGRYRRKGEWACNYFAI